MSPLVYSQETAKGAKALSYTARFQHDGGPGSALVSIGSLKDAVQIHITEKSKFGVSFNKGIKVGFNIRF